MHGPLCLVRPGRLWERYEHAYVCIARGNSIRFSSFLGLSLSLKRSCITPWQYVIWNNIGSPFSWFSELPSWMNPIVTQCLYLAYCLSCYTKQIGWCLSNSFLSQPELLAEVLVEEAVDDWVGAGTAHADDVTDGVDQTHRSWAQTVTLVTLPVCHIKSLEQMNPYM